MSINSIAVNQYSVFTASRLAVLLEVSLLSLSLSLVTKLSRYGDQTHRSSFKIHDNHYITSARLHFSV